MKNFVFALFTAWVSFGCHSNRPIATTGLATERAAVDTTQTLTTIAFGSCNKTTLPQPLWGDILAQQPNLWIWLGDNIYGDTDNMKKMRRMYAEQLAQPDYQQLITSVPVIGTWDDHDYGVNDGGKEFSEKAASRDLMLEFLGVPKNRAIWNREGAYQSYTFGPAGHQVKVLLLDTRYFRDNLVASTQEGLRYGPTAEGDLLGDAQWQWLENELRDSDAQINIIGSSIQVLAEDHGFEKWANFPQSRQRLFQLIGDSQASGVVLLSGDRHIGEVSRYEAPYLPYPLYDITSSGLTHVYEQADEENRHRVSDLISVLNFGLITLDWSSKPVRVTYQIKGEEGTVLAQETVTL